MITDQGLRLATGELVNAVNAGAAPGGLGPASVTLALDPSGTTPSQRIANDIGAGQKLLLNFEVTTGFTIAASPQGTLEFQLVSLPIPASALTNATTSGKLLSAVVPTNSTTDLLTLTNSNVPVAAPVWFSSIDTTTGIVVNRIYYTIPVTASTFGLALTVADATAATPVFIDLLTGNGTTSVLNFIPTIHASSGSLPLYFLAAQTPTNQGPLRAGTRFQVPVRPQATRTPKQQLPGGQTLKRAIGAGPMLGQFAHSAQRFYYLRYIPTVTITAGAVTCDLVADAGDALKFEPSGYEVVG